MIPIITKRYVSPAGPLLLGSYQNTLCLCDWRTEVHSQRIDKQMQQRLSSRYQEGTSDCIEATLAQLEEYFTGQRLYFDIPLLLVGTDFQKQVWNELLHIPYGETISYAELAQRIGKPTATRAVARANGTNPLSILIPCHRVIGSNQTLIGYGGGLTAKRMLLELEKRWLESADGLGLI